MAVGAVRVDLLGLVWRRWRSVAESAALLHFLLAVLVIFVYYVLRTQDCL